MSKFWCVFVKITGWLPFVLLCRTKYYYEDAAVQGRKIRGKAIIMPNHHDIWDFVTIMMAFFGRIIRCIVAELMFEEKGKIMSWLLKKLGCIKVDRNEQDFTFVTQSCDVLDKGGVVEIYPESRLPAEGEQTPLEFKPSVVYIALSSGAPVIPVVTNGSYYNKKRLHVLIGKPIDVATLYDDDLSEEENIENITGLLREKIIKLNDELARRTSKKEEKAE